MKLLLNIGFLELMNFIESSYLANLTTALDSSKLTFISLTGPSFLKKVISF